MLANYFDACEPSTKNFDFIFPPFLHSNALSDPKDQSHIHRLIHSEEECCQQSDIGVGQVNLGSTIGSSLI